MLWKLFGLQKLLDTLFDDTWCCPCVAVSEGFPHEQSSAPKQD